MNMISDKAAAVTAPANTAAHDTALSADGDAASVTSTLFLSITVSIRFPTVRTLLPRRLPQLLMEHSKGYATVRNRANGGDSRRAAQPCRKLFPARRKNLHREGFDSRAKENGRTVQVTTRWARAMFAVDHRAQCLPDREANAFSQPPQVKEPAHEQHSAEKAFLDDP
jgi:hypothetical protein